jgi:beta-lactamase superfamily II metal-dependent hydrolase
MSQVRVYILNNHGKSESNVVIFPSGLAVIIDCGSNGRLTLDCLRQLKPTKIWVILTHLERDHCGGAQSVLSTFEKHIKRIYLKPDNLDATGKRVFKFIKLRVAKGELPDPHELGADAPRKLHSEIIGTVPASISVFSPSVMVKYQALLSKNPNISGAVIKLVAGKSSMILGDDVPLNVWKGIKYDLNCDVFLIPHHGGPQDGSASYDVEDLAVATKPKFAFVSVGTRNGYGLPAPRAIRAFRDVGAYVGCTQITDQCHADLSALAPNHVIDQTSTLDHAGYGVNCMGTIGISLAQSGIRIVRIDEHRKALLGKVPQRHCI